MNHNSSDTSFVDPFEPIAYTWSVDGEKLPVYQLGDRQCVIDDNGEESSGVWFFPAGDADTPILVEDSGF